ncbi:MAG: hypothetical protein GWN47_01990 [Woeseiaceae bacterium]|nr:hypothetical protein [Woeseiaceae bacterium]
MKVRIIPLLVIAMLATEAQAAVTANVDRAEVDLNESFTLEIRSDTNTELQPDVSVLDQDFYVGQGSQLSDTSIINGQIRRSKTWTYVLMPRRAGQLTIPAITIGTEQTQPVTLTVSEPDLLPPGEAEVFITSEVDLDETYVQAQALLTIKIYRSVATRQPALREPTFSGIEYLLEIAGDDRSYDAVINGTGYNVVERVYAIYPQESGELAISPARFEARILRDGRITGRKVFQSDPQTITVLPIPAPPADYPDATWLPARDLTMSEDWSREPDEIKAGEPLTRHVTFSALGQLESQIPALDPPAAPGVNVYPDKPELGRRVESKGIRGIRKDQYAMIATSPGEVVLPALEVPWWNIDAGEWQVASLPERTIRILPSGEAPSPPPEATTSTDAEAVTEEAEPAGDLMPSGGFWRRVSEFLAALWLVTVVAWWWSSRPEKKPREPEPVPIYRQQARHLKAARKAAVAGDGAGVRKALLDWATLEWPDDAPRSIGVLASRVSAPLADELNRMSSAAYGPNGGEWNGEALAKAIRSFSVIEHDGPHPEDLLPPLMPRNSGRDVSRPK